MKRLVKLALPVFLLATLLVGCHLPQKFATDEQEATAKAWLQQLRDRHFDAVEAATDPSLRTDALRSELQQMADVIPPGTPTSVVLVGDRHMSVNGATMVNLTYEYDYGGHYVLANVAIRTRDGVSNIVGLSAYKLKQPLEAQHRFDLAGHAPVAYLALAGAILSPLVAIFALVTCIRTPLKGRKWPWIVFILFGFCTLNVSWATDEWAFQPLSFQLLGAAVTSLGAYSPWILGCSLPVGALLFLSRRRQLRADPPADPSPDAAPAQAGATAA